MFSLEIQDEVLCFKDIRPVHLPQILKWYNMVDDFKYATGIDKPITLQEMERKYAEVAICSNEFFVGIYLKKEMKMIGILKGYLKYENKDAVWISSIVIDPRYQKNGFGRQSIELLLNYLKNFKKMKSTYLAVVESNREGFRFWHHQGFREVRRIQNHLKLQDKHQNVIIMGKQLA